MVLPRTEELNSVECLVVDPILLGNFAFKPTVKLFHLHGNLQLLKSFPSPRNGWSWLFGDVK